MFFFFFFAKKKGRSNGAFEPDQKPVVVDVQTSSGRKQRPRQREVDTTTGFSNVAFQNDGPSESSETPPPSYPASMTAIETDEEAHHQVAKDRATWGHPVEFLMSCIAMSVGLGNFPPN